MNKKLLYTIIGIGLLIVMIFGVYCATTMQEKKIKQLEKQIVYLKTEIIPLRFKILTRTKDSIIVKIKFYDLDRNLVYYYDDQGEKQEAVIIKIPGQELSFDFIVVPIGNRFLAFPYKVFSDAIAPKDGIILFPYYDRENFPQVYFSRENSPAFNAGVKALFDKIKKGQIQDIQGIFGSMVQDVKDLQQFQVGQIYRVVIHPAKGGIEIIKD